MCRAKSEEGLANLSTEAESSKCKREGENQERVKEDCRLATAATALAELSALKTDGLR